MNEFDVIARYFSRAVKYSSQHVVIGPGDDCAVMRVPQGHALCVSTDTLLEGVHFPLGLPPALSGEITANRMMAANLSDLAAMGAVPYGFTLALTLPTINETWLASFSSRLSEIVLEYKVPLIGGNIAKGTLSLTANILGLIHPGEGLLRSGAKVGDRIFVSGHLGSAAGGLKCHQQNPGLNSNLIQTKQALYQPYFNPVPRVSLGQRLIGVASACIDISDGLTSDLKHICTNSRVSARIRCANLPLASALVDTFGAKEAETMALSGGDDYELCFTVPTEQLDALASISEALGLQLTSIGDCTAASAVGSPGEELMQFFDEDGQIVSVPSGYKHF